MGGQAGESELIENYPGFSQGVGGAELANEMKIQAERFGVEILLAQMVTGVKTEGDYKVVSTESGDEYCSRALLLVRNPDEYVQTWDNDGPVRQENFNPWRRR